MGRVGVGFGIDGHRAHAHAAGGADDAAGDFAAIGDQQRGIMRITSGTRRSACRGIGALRLADSARPSTSRGLRRIDHAVVPEPRGGDNRDALGLVARADRRLEGLLVLGRPGPALRFDAVAVDGGEHAGGLLAAHDADAAFGQVNRKRGE